MRKCTQVCLCAMLVCCCCAIVVLTTQSNSPKAPEAPSDQLIGSIDQEDFVSSNMSSYPGTTTGPGVMNGYNSTPSGNYPVDLEGNRGRGQDSLNSNNKT